MYSAGTFKLRDFDYFSLDEDTGIPSANEHKFESWEKIQEYVEGSSEDELQGVIVFQGRNMLRFSMKCIQSALIFEVTNQVLNLGIYN